MSDSNEIWNYAALTEERDDYGVLPAKANDLLTRLRKEVSKKWREADEVEKKRLSAFTGTLDRLRSFHLQVSRMDQHETSLASHLKDNRSNPEQTGTRLMATHAGDEATTDFESLLIHARAALDRLTLLVSREHKQNSDRFSRLGNVLGNFAATDERAASVISLLQQVPAIAGVLVDIETSKALRSQIAHRSSLTEGVRNHFTVHYLPKSRILLFDCEAYGRGVLTTARQLAVDIPFLVLNVTKIYLLGGSPISRASFQRKMRLPVAVFSDAIDPKGLGPLMAVATLGPDEFTLTTEHVKPDVVKLAKKISG